jgi:hypothetical protein
MDNFPDIINEYGLSGPVVVRRTCKMEQGTCPYSFVKGDFG